MSLDLTAILVATLSGMGGVFAVMQSRAANAKATALEARKVDKDDAVKQRRLDLEEDQAHWARTDDIITRLRDEVDRLDRALIEARAELDTAHTDNVALRGRVDACELHIVKLKAIVALLTSELERHGLPVPGSVD